MKGLKNHYQTHGLGVPLIAVRRSYQGEPAAARYYPPGLSFPVTAFLRPLPGSGQAGRNQGLLELYDPLATNDTRVGNLIVPLESDLTTPLAYFLSKVPMETWPPLGLLATRRSCWPCGPTGRPRSWVCTWCSPTSRARSPCCWSTACGPAR